MMPDIDQLYQKFLMQQCSPEEAAWLLHYFSTTEGKAQLASLATKEFEAAPTAMLADEAIRNSLRDNRAALQKAIQAPKVYRFRLLGYAALLMVVVTASFFIVKNYGHTEEILPATSKATLSLPDGSVIALKGERKAIAAKNNTIVYEDGSALGNAIDMQPSQLLSLSTPKGGLYQVVLSDGSKVWLNTATVLRYPIKFTGRQRLVELDGEAYFEVAENKACPFIIKSKGQDIKVLGTAFNVSAYSTEAVTRTTLLRGAVALSTASNAIRLYPGQEASMANHRFTKKDVDATQAIAWMEGNFSFDDETLLSVMAKIARWYDVEVSYQNVDGNARFYGGISRYDNLQTVLNRLEKTGGVHFKVLGRRVIVTK